MDIWGDHYLKGKPTIFIQEKKEEPLADHDSQSEGETLRQRRGMSTCVNKFSQHSD